MSSSLTKAEARIVEVIRANAGSATNSLLMRTLPNARLGMLLWRLYDMGVIRPVHRTAVLEWEIVAP